MKFRTWLSGLRVNAYGDGWVECRFPRWWPDDLIGLAADQLRKTHARNSGLMAYCEWSHKQHLLWLWDCRGATEAMERQNGARMELG